MKLILSMATIAISLSSTIAAAGVMRQPCDFRSYQYIQQALAQGRVLEGAEKKSSLLSMLAQEMGPSCTQLIPTSPGFGIPGTQYSQYEISSGGTQFDLSISFSRVTDPGFKVYIK